MNIDLPNIREDIYSFVIEFANRNDYAVYRSPDKANCRLIKKINSHKIFLNMGIHHNRKHHRLEFNGFSTGIVQYNYSNIIRDLVLRNKEIHKIVTNSHPNPNINEIGLCTVSSWLGLGSNSNPLLSYNNRRIRITSHQEIDLFKNYITEYEKLIQQCLEETTDLINVYEKISALPIEELVDKLYSEYLWSLPNPLIFLIGFRSSRIDEYIDFLNKNDRISNEIERLIELLKDKEIIKHLNDSLNQPSA